MKSNIFAMVLAMVLGWLLLLSTSANAQLTIEITQGSDNPTPIAVVPFGGATGLPEDLQSIVAADLLRSGLFAPIPAGNMLALPRNAGEVFFRDWRVLGAAYLVVGQLSQAEGRYRLNFELFDVLAEKKLLERQVTGSVEQLRDMAHAVSDTVYETITGIRGVFSTKMLYVEDLKAPGRGRYRLMYADADGARERILFQSPEPLLSPAWSHDMRSIAYVSFETRRPAVFVQELGSGRRTQLTDFPGLNGAPSWSPDDKTLALVLSKDGNPEIYTLEIASRKLTRITNHFAIDTEPNWTADGRGLIFTSNRGGSPQIYQVDIASKRVERLTFDGDYNARPRVSPDGETLVMVNRSDGVFHIASQNIKSGDMRILTETLLDESPSIAPNGAMLLYATQYQGKGVLGAVSMDAGVKFRLPSKQGDVREPAWSPFVQK